MPEIPFAPAASSPAKGASQSTPAPPSQQLTSEALEAVKSDLLMVYRAVVALEKRVNESTVNMVEIKPQLIALKAHTESLPNALREIKRSQVATQKTVSEFEARLRNLETRLKGAGVPSIT
jgi:chromosome segregation ATPase